MAGPAVTASVLPVGGSVLFAFYGASAAGFSPPSGVTSLTISRAVGTGSFVQIYSGVPVPFYVDTNDGPSMSSEPLSATTAYSWQFSDATGTTEIGPIVPSGAIVTVPDGMTQLLLRLLQAAVENAPRPAGITVAAAQVTTRMPSGGWPATPFIVVNMDLLQQTDTAIGQDVLVPTEDNRWTLPGWVKRVWRVSVFSQNADERDFYRDTLLIAFRALKATLFSQVGQNIRHSYQASSGTTGDEWKGEGPGFYWADVMLDLEGTFDVTILTGFGLIEQIDGLVTASPGGLSP